MATGHSGLRVGLKGGAGGAGGAGGPGVEHMWRCERDADAAMKRDLVCLGRIPVADCRGHNEGPITRRPAMAFV